ncbi:hypothetical protein LTS18_004078 [Coniosporium uncinatum]|uniref:Uncharacterized protein n=1 Tax=Coniosporium uncinatum TaxID=93489 RepID=A0ACC3D649_9PEZI|nr:hypothetical protein LTS18_004078 [Coniosporium uncinatum]
MATIQEAAESFTAAYASAMQCDTTTSLSDCASLLVSHYGPSFTSFTLGHVIELGNSSQALKSVENHLKRFNASGLGYDIAMTEHRIDVLSAGSALCHVTWQIKPKAESGVEGWKWTNCYGFRRNGNGEGNGWWEFVVSDQEYEQLVGRMPGFMGIEV